MRKFFTVAIVCAITFIGANKIYAQSGEITGQVGDAANKEILVGVTVIVDDTVGTSTNATGFYRLQVSEGKHKIAFRMLGYQEYKTVFTISPKQALMINAKLKVAATDMGMVVVSASKFEQKLNEVVVSMNVVKPQLIENNNQTSLTGVMEQVPGVTIVDNQANIRGGSGFSYGAGTRVLMLVDELPLLAADANDVKWSFMPIENIEQVEIIKGASSALFGSSALNGIINVRTAYPKSTPETKINFFAGMYDQPKDRRQRFWGKEDVQAVTGYNFLHSQQIKNLDLVFGGMVNNDDSYREGDNEKRFRVNTNLRYRVKTLPGFSFGVNANYQRAQGSTFFIWRNDTTGGLLAADNTISDYNTQRFSVDPFVTYVSPHFGTHKLKFRNFNTRNYNNTDQSSFANNNYLEYQYQQIFAELITVTAGAVNQDALIRGEFFNRHTSTTTAFYLQTDWKWKRFNFSLGGRMENNVMDTIKIDYKPVLRSGVNVELRKGTNIRASYGQGYRFPSVAERYVKTNIGIVSVFPNDSLITESGWSAELGIQQGYKFGNTLGYIDVAVFQMEYTNMMEFVYGVWSSTNIGFSSRNIGNTRITGIDITWFNQGKFGKIPLNIFAGYTNINPIKTDYNPKEDTVTGTANFNILKYRYRQMLKADVETGYGKFLIGANVRYYSEMENIDRIFAVFIAGVDNYQKTRKGGDWITDVRLIYNANARVKIGAVVKNVTNRFYVNRPANPQALRFFSLQVSCKF
jgi:iron complex outermembrane receptor protein